MNSTQAEAIEARAKDGGNSRWPAFLSPELRMLLVIWLVVCVAKTLLALPILTDRTFPDPDDALRLVQVRDWLAGQSWFDVTQYRLNPPFGGPMHWSRLVDLPIAAVILLFRPFVGQYNAETAALVIVPMVTLGIAMLLVQRIALKLANARTALLAVVATPASLGAMTQMRISRIDHHGWQIVFALAVTLAALDSRPRRSGIIAGAVVGLWLNVSIESLPFAVATAALFAFMWLGNPAATDRLKAFLASLAVTTAALFGLTHWPSVWMVMHHDSLNTGHLAAFAAAGLCGLLVVRSTLTDIRYRLAALAIVGVAATAAIFAVDPHFLQSPFAFLDPLVRNLWFNAVDEGQPVWHLTAKDAAVALAQPIVGLAGAAFAIRKTPAEDCGPWYVYTFLLAAGTLCAIAVTREATNASLLSLPGTAFACEFALSRARSVAMMPKRVLATFGALCIMAPAYTVPAAAMPRDPNAGEPDFGAQCAHRSEIDHLNMLRPSILAIPLDITPAILADTRHTAVGSGHHRNVHGIKDMILLFVGPASAQRDVIVRRRIDYVVFCPGTAEAGWWSANGPHGLASMLSANKAPAWLEPVSIPGLHALKVWRVRKDSPALAHG